MALTRIVRPASTMRRRGIALLLVLAMLVLIVPLAVGMAQRASLTALNDRLTQHEVMAGALREQIESGPLATWLNRESSRIILPPEVRMPRVEVLRESWVLDDVEYEVRLTAWDQCGMAALQPIRSGSPLRSAVPAAVLRRLDTSATAILSEPFGLDQFSAPVDSIASIPGGVLSAFPMAGDADVHSIGAWVATHPVGSAGSINVNTAPLPLIETAMSQAGRGGIDVILNARREGRLAALPAAATSTSGDQQRSGEAPRLVAVSSSWSVRIDIRVGTARRSWWTVHRQSSGRWECVQRCVIPD